MTPEERAFCEEIRADAMKLIGAAGLMMQDAQPDSREYLRAQKISVGLLGLVSKAAARINQADVVTDAAQLAAGGYDLAALSTAPPATIED